MKHIAIPHLLIGALALTVHGRQTAQQSTDKTPSLAKCKPGEGPRQPTPEVKRVGKAKILCDIRSWAGEWQTSYGMMKLHFDDEVFSGNYGPSAHAVYGRFNAKSPCVLQGRWQHTNSQSPGRFTFRMTGPGKFTGNWSSGNADPDVSGIGWHGTRAIAPAVVLPKKITLIQLELEQAKHRARLMAKYRELLNAQITEITALRKKYVKQGDAQKAADAARMLAELRRLTDFKPVLEKKKLFVEAIMDAKPATVDMMLLKPARLKESANKEQGRWARVPNALMGASIYATPPTGANGTADFRVTRGGQVYLALNYDYQGNSGGGWTEERWMPEDFMAAGWAQVRGAQMVAWNNRTYSIFTRKLEKGEQFRLRCNKYEPPYVILLDGGKAAKAEESAPEPSGLFKDPKLEAAVRKALGKPVGDITPRDLASLEKLEASFLGITDITGLEHATNLTSLNLSQNPINDVTPLGGLTMLKRLLLYKNRITDLKPLADLPNVEFVTFWETNVSDLAPLQGWKNLKSIELRLTKVTDYTPLHGLTNLKSLATNRRLISDEQLAMLKKALPNCKIEIEKRGP